MTTEAKSADEAIDDAYWKGHADGHADAIQEINEAAKRITHFHYYDDGGMGPCSITQFNVDDDPNEIAGSRQVVQGESFTDVLDRLVAAGGDEL